MANAKIENVKKTVTKEVPERIYTLKLTEEEASTLYALTGAIVGDRFTTYSNHTSSIFDELYMAGVPYAMFRSRFSLRNGGNIVAAPLPK